MNHNTRKKTARTLGALGTAVAAWLKLFNKEQPAIEDDPNIIEEGDLEFSPISVAETLGEAVGDADSMKDGSKVLDMLKAPAQTFMDFAKSDTGKAISSAAKVLSSVATVGKVGFALWDIFSPQKRHERAVQAAMKSLEDTATYEYLKEVARFAKKIQSPNPENVVWNKLVNYRVAELLKYMTYPETSEEFNEVAKGIMDEAMKGDEMEAMAARLAITQASTISSREAAQKYTDECNFEMFNSIGKLRLEAMQKMLIEAAKNRARAEREQQRGMKRLLRTAGRDIVGALEETEQEREAQEMLDRVTSGNRRSAVKESTLGAATVEGEEDPELEDRVRKRLDELKYAGYPMYNPPTPKRKKSSGERRFKDPRTQALYDEIRRMDEAESLQPPASAKTRPARGERAGKRSTRSTLRKATEVSRKLGRVGKQIEKANRAANAIDKAVKVVKVAKKVRDFKNQIGLGMIKYRNARLKKRSIKKKR